MSSRLVAGSPAAMAWAAKMQKKKSAIRAAGLRTEKQFFGPGGEFADEAAAKQRKNPKLSWLVIVDYLKNEGWKPLGKKGMAAFGRNVRGLDQVLQLEARAWRVLYSNIVTFTTRSLGTYKDLDRALIAANRQANDWIYNRKSVQYPKKNPITLNGNPPKRIRADIAGVMYNRVWEVQAEKTGDTHKGFWYHPFKKGSDVQMLALDNGDVMLHSKAGKKLWTED